MKRAPFLSATAAAALAGCGGGAGRSVISGLNAVAQGPSKPSTSAVVGVPATAPPIPQSVLSNPLIGEARRFDGAVAPAGWLLAQGQTLNISSYPQLFTILRTIDGGDGKQTFALPHPSLNAIIAFAGTYPSSPTVVTNARRRSPTVSLGPGAVPAIPRTKPPSPEVIEARRLAASAVQPRVSARVPVSADLAARMNGAKAAAETTALAQLSAANRSRVQAEIANAVAGSVNLSDTVNSIAGSLSGSEAAAVLKVSDEMTASFRSGWSAASHANPQQEAARFLVSVAVTRDQLRAALSRPNAQ